MELLQKWTEENPDEKVRAEVAFCDCATFSH